MTLVRTMRAMRLLNAAILGNVNGAQMQALLADPSRLTQWQQLLTQRGQMQRLVASPTAMAAVIASNTAMSAVAASGPAMAAVAASGPAMAAVIASNTAMLAVAASGPAMAAVAASGLAMAAVIASSTAMAAVAASGPAMAAVAASGLAMAAVNASTTAMDAIYASPLVTKVNLALGQFWSTPGNLRSGKTLFVRLTTKGASSGWGEASLNEWVSYDGSQVFYSERVANPYNHTSLTASPRLPLRRCATSLQIKSYFAGEVAYIALIA